MPFADITYLHCPLDDAPHADMEQCVIKQQPVTGRPPLTVTSAGPLCRFFAQFLAFAQSAKDCGRRVLVHCKMGMR